MNFINDKQQEKQVNDFKRESIEDQEINLEDFSKDQQDGQVEDEY